VRATHVLDCFDVDTVGAISEAVGIHGEGWAVGAASASGSIALIQAARLLSAGFAERCLVVAPANELSSVELLAFARSGAMVCGADGASTELACRPFDEARTGFAFGQIAAAVVLERWDGALARGVRPLARVLGYGQRLDAKRDTAASTAQQIVAMQTALDSAGLGPTEIDYVNAHATGSILGDAAEAAALSAVFGSRPRVNSTKGLVGHGLGAAGLVEIVAVVLQIGGSYCHGNPLLREPLRRDLRFVGTSAEPCQIRHALSNSFAFGGINSAVVIGNVEEG
jgi:malonyl-ACP decarboxylase